MVLNHIVAALGGFIHTDSPSVYLVLSGAAIATHKVCKQLVRWYAVMRQYVSLEVTLTISTKKRK